MNKKINAAKKIAEIGPLEYKKELFQAALTNLLADKSVEKQTTNSTINEETKTFNIGNLSKISGFSEDSLENIYNTNIHPFRLLVTYGNTVAEKMQNSTILLLFAWKYGHNRKEVSSSTIKEQITFSNLVKISTTYGNSISKISKLIYRKGKQGSTSTEYGLTRPGESESLGLLKKLILEEEKND